MEDEETHIPVVVESEETDPAMDSILSALDIPRDTYKDYNKVRDALVTALESGRIATADALTLAQAMDHPRAYEVLATMIKTMGDMNNDLLGMHEKKQKLTGEKPEDKKETVNNNLFVGSTSELLKLMNKDDS